VPTSPAFHPGWVSTAIVVIVAITLYAGVFRVLGGFGGAAAALRRWGERSSTVQSASTSSTLSHPNHNIAP
jgi:hypothetical protein